MATDNPKMPDTEQPAKAPDILSVDAGGNAPAPEQPTPAPAKADPAKVVSFEQVKTAAKETPATPGKADKAPEKPPAPARRGRPPRPKEQAAPAVQPDKDAALQKQQEALLAEMDAKAAFHEQGKPRAPKQQAAPAKKPPTEKAAPAEKKVDRAAIEKELREMYGIPKSEKPIAAWVPPETETVEKLTHKQLRPFNNHPFNVDTKDPKFMALTVSIRTHGITQPIIARPIPGAKGQLEIVSGHRRQAAALAAGLDKVPVIVRALNNDQAIQQMVEDTASCTPAPRGSGWIIPGHRPSLSTGKFTGRR